MGEGNKWRQAAHTRPPLHNDDAQPPLRAVSPSSLVRHRLKRLVAVIGMFYQISVKLQNK